jgi:GH24 family phage-related lysozyme (muramidase)
MLVPAHLLRCPRVPDWLGASRATARSTLGVYPSVQYYLPRFSQAFEGRVTHMYLDIKGLVTVGVGNLIDPVELALALPFRFKNSAGTAADREQIAAEWQAIKSDPSLGEQGAPACAPLTALELSDEAIDALIAQRAAEDEKSLKRQAQFANFEAWPADAQLALLSMAWALGPGGVAGFPKLSAACRALDFHTAAAECEISADGNAGVVPRNAANRALFRNAAHVRAVEASAGPLHSTLFYPKVLTSPVPVG